MTLKGALARVRYEVVSLLLECAIAVATLAAFLMSVPMILILASQLNRLAMTGDWREFPFSEFLELVRIDPSSLQGETQAIAKFFLALPATLLLLLAALALCLLAGVLHRLNKRERARFGGMQQSAMIKDIERKLEAR
jgi:hypothetical protein